MPVFATGGDDTAVTVGLSRGNTYSWWQADVRTSRKAKPITITRRRYRGPSMLQKDTPWRHAALTWDSEARRFDFYLDYQHQGTATLDEVPDWDISRLRLGTGDGQRIKAFEGAIDSVRVTPRRLEPWEFQRATDIELTDVSFAPEAEPALPADYGQIDVRLHYGAVGDGVHDDTAAIKRAFEENDNRVPIEYRTVYFPAGTYRITDSIRFDRFMVVRGAGREKTVIKLDDNAPGYATPEVPKPAFAVGYDWPYVDRPKKNKAGNAIGSHVYDLTIDTGSGNPSALGLDYHSNNLGAVENVTIRSGDGSGMVGLDLKRGWPGPCLIKNVVIDGFDSGIEAAHREYSLVFSGVTLRNQNKAVIVNRGNTLSMENIDSDNDVPAVENLGGGLITMINSRLAGGTSDQTAVASKNSSLYLRNVEIGGYGTSVVETRQKKDAAAETVFTSTDRRIAEHFTGPFDHAFPTEEAGSLKLPIMQTPAVDRPPVSEWTNVTHYRDLVSNGDWAPAIQAAIDAGKPLVYFPEGEKYAIAQDVIVRNGVRTFFGGSPKMSIRNGESKKNEGDPNGPAIRIGPSVELFQLDMCTVDRLVHDTPATLVVQHCRVNHVDAGPECGDLFIEDCGGKLRFNEHQRVWGRQLNPETKEEPEIINDGGQLWMLGMKTEYLSTKIINRNGARTELLGGLMYPVHPVQNETLPMFINENSDLSLIHSVSVYKKNHKVYIRDTQHGETIDVTAWHWDTGHPIVNLYRSER